MARPCYLRMVALEALVLTAACHPAFTPKQVDHVHAACQEALDKEGDPGGLKTGRVGFLGERQPRGTPVMIYGAPWCGACDYATSYLAQRGIPFIEKDIEDHGVAAERDALIARAGLGASAAVPVMDVRGTVTLGFMPCVVEYAWVAQ